MIKHGITIIAFFGVFLITANALTHAEIYKWVDKQGNAHFTDNPPDGQKTEEIKVKINTFPAVEVTSLSLRQLPAKSGKVIMYSAEWCGICRKAKRYFKKNKISHKIYDIDKSKIGRKKFNKLGGRAVPIIIVGTKRMNGFSVKRFSKLYETEIVQKKKEEEKRKQEKQERKTELALKKKAEIAQKSKERAAKKEEAKTQEAELPE